MRVPAGEPSAAPAPSGAAWRLVYIAGSGHSGSTLLDMLLGGNSRVAGLGEVSFLNWYMRHENPRTVCACGAAMSACPFWTAVEREALAMSGVSNPPALASLPLADPRLFAEYEGHDYPWDRDVTKPRPHRSLLREGLLAIGSRRLYSALSNLSHEVALYREIAANRMILYEAVHRAHGSRVIVDSTKNPGIMKALYLYASMPVSIVVVLRDGRAVCSSTMRRMGCSMSDAAMFWKREQQKRLAALATVPRAAMFEVRYEDLSADPEAELQAICTRLGLPYEKRMLEFRADRHNVGGNPMRLRSEERRIEPDERWKSELDASDLAEFARVAGRMNRRLGYA